MHITNLYSTMMKSKEENTETRTRRRVCPQRRRQCRRSSMTDMSSMNSHRSEPCGSTDWVKELNEEREAILRETALEKDEIDIVEQRIMCYKNRPHRRRSMGDIPFSFENSPSRRESEDWMTELMEERNSVLRENELLDDSDATLSLGKLDEKL
mmetsp:Transcript_3446/g.5134  ORF Transcript_3446/g.5134 Transcript_3446/m.5134 type:complete len:154 (+) Transcript_3446:276-737(+)|eukprot:CAMPEP_0194200750 /NCGR_PEP_ID=MMETSP0156-20130528/1228_1 /TAXON_ID=33649 /ORGANISM="Thalassionema nitzschioides, Strain L26-B" /LENGTH=153 /DNA_ID=CAMNT_0038925797 /DNA_START=210 /DNA_END=674 /DNA_ORIENTATION=-